jgi:2-alkyl-3-oxoalkanoate reductase
METERQLRVGIVGCGGIAAAQWGHIPALKKISNVKLAAVCDVNESLAKKVSENFHIDRYYGDISEMLKRGKLDIVHICTPPKTHAALSITAMKSGCNVLVEKPMSVSTEECDEMIRASKENGMKLCVVHNNIFTPMIMRAKSIVNEGVIGDLTGIDYRDAWPKDSAGFINKDHWHHKLPCGVFGEMLPHPIYVEMAFLGKLEPVSVYAKKLSSYEWVIVDELRIILEGERGIGTITASCNWPKGGKDEATVDMFGTKSNLHADLQTAVLTKYGAGGGSRTARVLDNLRQDYQQLTCISSAAFNSMLGRHRTGHHNLIERFAEAVRNDTAPPVSGEEGREVVRVLEKIDALMKTSLRRA